MTPDRHRRENTGEIGVSCTSMHRITSENGEGGIRTRETGVNPPDGLANRWFQPLTHLSKVDTTKLIRISLAFLCCHDENLDDNRTCR